jgi:hypothetical protein
MRSYNPADWASCFTADRPDVAVDVEHGSQVVTMITG